MVDDAPVQFGPDAVAATVLADDVASAGGGGAVGRDARTHRVRYRRPGRAARFGCRLRRPPPFGRPATRTPCGAQLARRRHRFRRGPHRPVDRSAGPQANDFIMPVFQVIYFSILQSKMKTAGKYIYSIVILPGRGASSSPSEAGVRQRRVRHPRGVSRSKEDTREFDRTRNRELWRLWERIRRSRAR